MNKPLTARIICSLLLAASCTSCGQTDSFDDWVKAEMTRQHIPGLSLAVVKEGKIVKSAGYGLADLESKASVTTDTIFQIQSVTKQFTAAGIMLLVEEEKIGLDDPVSQYLENTPPAWQAIKVHHLLGQTSGLKDFINDSTGNLKFDATDQQILEDTADRPLDFPPGEAWAYSNTNYHLLAMIIRKVSGKWYGDFLSERIFTPLGMTRTAVMRPDETLPDQAKGYLFENGQFKPGTIVGPAILGYGGGGVRSTVLDMAKWDAALYGEQILKQSSLKQMWTPVPLNNGTTHEYGFGWEMAQVAGHRQIWHAGNFSSGFSAQFSRFVDDHLTVIVLANRMGANTAGIARAAAATVLPELAVPVYKPIADAEPDVTRRLTDLLRRSAQGELRSEEFTPEMWAGLAPRMDQMRKDFSVIGPVEKLTLVQRSADGTSRSYRYRAQFKRTSFIMHFVITPEDKIALMLPEDVNQ